MHSHKTRGAADKSPDEQLLEVARREGWILKWSIFEWCSKHPVGDSLVLHTHMRSTFCTSTKCSLLNEPVKNAHSPVE